MSEAVEGHHDLFVYDADERFADEVERYLLNGLETGRAVLAVATDAKRELLHETLGAEAKRISFVDNAAVYTRPEEVLARYDGALRKSLHAGGPGFCVYGELPICRTRAEWDRWMVYEAILNLAFAGRPAKIMCGYDARVVPGDVLQLALRSHRHVLTEEWQASPGYLDPAALASVLTPLPEPLHGLRSLPVGDPRESRRRIAAELAAAGIGGDRARDLVLAAGEALANAERHGNGVRALRAGRVGERFVCEVTDCGAGFDDPLAGYLPPAADGIGGAGLWVARQLTTRLEVFSDTGGFTVRLWA
jgi:anti-sigma regulatory factor (Ser/Thr protein kinase)